MAKKIALALAMISLLASSAQARRIVVDSDRAVTTDDCEFVDCSPFILPFQINFGTGLTNEVYIYSNGLVSLGQSLEDPFSSRGFLALPSHVVAGAYSRDVIAYYDGSGPSSASVTFKEILDTVGFLSTTQFLEILFTDRSDTGQIGDFSIKISYDPFDETFFSEYFPQGEVAGFNVGELQRSIDLSELEVSDETSLYPTFEHVFRVQAVPEPTTWIMMIIGFGFLGHRFRRSGVRARAELRHIRDL